VVVGAAGVVLGAVVVLVGVVEVFLSGLAIEPIAKSIIRPTQQILTTIAAFPPLPCLFQKSVNPPLEVPLDFTEFVDPFNSVPQFWQNSELSEFAVLQFGQTLVILSILQFF
jgi:hypothetical protein